MGGLISSFSNRMPLIQRDQHDCPCLDNYSSHCIECVTAIPVKRRDQIKKGDHIKFARYGLYDHHAIVLNVVPDGNEHNVHKALLTLIAPDRTTKIGDLPKAEIKITDNRVDFTNNNISIIKYNGLQIIPENTIKRAKGLMESCQTPDGPEQWNYNLLLNNCEHFARWCVTCEHYSTQSEYFKNKIFEKSKSESAEKLFKRRMLCKSCFLRRLYYEHTQREAITQTNYKNIKEGDIIREESTKSDMIVVFTDLKTDGNKISCRVARYNNGEFAIIWKRISLDGKFSLFIFEENQFLYPPKRVISRAENRLMKFSMTDRNIDSSLLCRWCKLKRISSSSFPGIPRRAPFGFPLERELDLRDALQFREQLNRP